MFKLSKFSVPRSLIETVRQAANKSGGKGSGDKGKDASTSKKDGKGGSKCGGVPPTGPPAAGDGKAPFGSLGGVGRESSCKLKVKQPAKGASTAGAYKKICLYGIIPALVVLNVLILSTRTHEERPEFKKWAHLYKRDKPFPWRDGVKSLFHNSHTNALPESGYEDE